MSELLPENKIHSCSPVQETATIILEFRWTAVLPLLHNDRQVHPLMDRTIDVIGSRCAKWSNLNTLAIDLYIIDGRCAWLFRWFGHSSLPTAVCKNVEYRHIIYQQELRALGKSDRRLTKLPSTHMYGRHPVCISRTCRCAWLRDGGDENGANNHPRYSGQGG